MQKKRFKAWIYRLESRLSRSRLLFRGAVKIRNQANIMIGLHLSDGTDIQSDGERLLAEFAAPLCRSFVDVGANEGEWTKIFAAGMRPGGQGLCVEPGARVYEALEAALRKISRTSVEHLEAALADQEYEGVFWEHDRSVYSGMVRTDAYGPAHPRKVRVLRLDRVLEERGWKSADFLKIDTEGFDFRVIRGAGRFVDEATFRVIQFEYGANWITVGDTLHAAVHFLKTRGYELFLLRRDGLHQFDVQLLGEYFWYSNFVAIRDADLPTFAPLIHDRALTESGGR